MFAYLGTPRCAGHPFWVRDGAMSYNNMIIVYPLPTFVNVIDPCGRMDTYEGRTFTEHVQVRKPRLRGTLLSFRVRQAGTRCQNHLVLFATLWAPAWEKPRWVWVQLFQSCPKWTHGWVSLQENAATRSAPFFTSTPSPRSRTALGTTVAFASMVGVRVAGPPCRRPVFFSSAHITPYLSCLFQQNKVLGIWGVVRLFFF